MSFQALPPAIRRSSAIAALATIVAAIVAAISAPSAASQEREPEALRAKLITAAAPVVLDGALDDAVWKDAPGFEAFQEYEPKNGNAAPAHLRTTVRLLIDDNALVFGIRAWDTRPALMQGSLTRRDKVSQDQDFIGIWIDPSGHGRSAQFVRINIAGALSDGLYRADVDESDLGPDFPVDSAVKLLADGYSMEVRWPLSSLRFPYAGGKNWRAMVERSVPHADSLLLLSTVLKSGSLSRITNLQKIEGMGNTVEEVRDRRFLELKPELTLRHARAFDGERGADGQYRERRTAAGLEITSRPRADWVLNATINPDFSQVEIDEPSAAGASRIALSLPEKRGFFLESADVLGMPLAAFYSRTVTDPDWGARATWRAAHADATALSLRDQEGGVALRGSPYATIEVAQAHSSLASMVRGRWHGEHLLLGSFVSRRDYGPAGSNNVLGLDGQWKGVTGDGGQNQLAWLAMHSRTDTRLANAGTSFARQGSYVWTKLSHVSDLWWNEARVEAITPGFINDNGFVPQAGVVKLDAAINRRLGPQQFDTLGLELYEFEAHLGLTDIRTFTDTASGQPGGQIVERKIQPGIWFFAPRQTRVFANLGFDRQRAHSLGKLHDTPALHLGVESSPFSWLAKLEAELSIGRLLDVEADRVGRGGEGMLQAGLRLPLGRGWAMELDQRFNRAWVRSPERRPGFTDSGWRTLAMLHFTAHDSLRLLVQNTAAARYGHHDDGLAPWAERGAHRSLLYRHLWRHGRSLSVGYARDGIKQPAAKTESLTVKFQWAL